MSATSAVGVTALFGTPFETPADSRKITSRRAGSLAAVPMVGEVVPDARVWELVVGTVCVCVLSAVTVPAVAGLAEMVPVAAPLLPVTVWVCVVSWEWAALTACVCVAAPPVVPGVVPLVATPFGYLPSSAVTRFQPDGIEAAVEGHMTTIPWGTAETKTSDQTET